MQAPSLPALSIDSDEERAEAEFAPPAPKRRRHGARADALAGFAAAARVPDRSMAADSIAAGFRGHRVRRDVARLRPTSASSSFSLEPPEEVPEEIVPDEDEMASRLKDLTVLTEGASLPALNAAASVDSALEESAEFESSSDSLNAACFAVPTAGAPLPHPPLQPQPPPYHERMCAICLAPLPRRRKRHEGVASAAPVSPAGMAVATLSCSHKFHRKCILGWCLQQPPGQCPLCREEVHVRSKRSSSDAL